MTTPTTSRERERLLTIANEYRDKGYEVEFQPSPEDLPDFLKNYRPNLIARRHDEAVVVEVASRHSLNDYSSQYLSRLAQIVEQHPTWRLDLVMTNPEEVLNLSKPKDSLQKQEIVSQLLGVRQLAQQHLESALLYAWSLVEATLRLVAENEKFSFQRSKSPSYLIKLLVTEGVISREEYELLMNALSLRHTIAHGFKTTQLTPNSVYSLIDITEQLLKTLSEVNYQ
jgi:uncharacterized protein YutE (UPF0331/DUF86 family)